MLKETQIDFMAATFKLYRLLLAVTIWSCHVLVAPSVRLCRGFAAAVIALQGPNNLSLRGVKRRGNLKKKQVATPPGLAMTCLERDCVYINHSRLYQLRSRATRIVSIPRMWVHGVKQPMGHAETPNSELRTPNFKGFTLIELIVVIIIIGILAATVLPRIDFGTTSNTTSVDGAAYMIASDIRYTQECAMANRVSKSIRFAIGQNSYTFPATVPSTSGLDSSGQLMSGVTISNNSTNPYIVQFNSLGEPIVGGNGWVEVTMGGQTKRIAVSQYTGKVDIS